MAAVGWGVVGCGWVARAYAIPAIRAAARLVAVYDSRGPSGLGARDAASIEDLVADPEVEAVYVATPNHAHRAAVEAAAAAGKAVLCEKPIAASLADAEAIVAAVARVPYATAYDQRFHGAHRALAELVAAGTLGTVTQARIHYACWLPADWSPDGAPHDNWRVDPRRAGGGAVIDLAPHGIDLVGTLLGATPVECQVMLQRRIHAYPVDDGGIVSVRYEGDVLASLAVAYNCPDSLPRRRLELIGTKASALAKNTMGQTPGGTLTLYDAAGAHPIAYTDRPPFDAQIAAFSAHVRGEPYVGSAAGDLAAFRLLDAALAAAAKVKEPPCR